MSDYLSQAENQTLEHDWQMFYHLKPEDIFVEVGAMWGSSLASVLGAGVSRAVLVEGDLDNTRTIEARVKKLGVGNKVQVINKAVSDKKGRGFYLRHGNPAGHMLQSEYWRWPKGYMTSEGMEVEIDTLAGILDSLTIDRVDLLGLDCEGSEVNALKYAGKWLSEKLIKNIGAEIHGEEAKIDVMRLLKEADYEIVSVQQAGAQVYAYARA